MVLPKDVPVMTLSNATLFPQAMLPLKIFEPRYRKMLKDALESDRVFAVAMQKPGLVREIPSGVAGVGLIRAAVTHKDGTSHVVLQGIARVELMKIVHYKPYRRQEIQPLETVGSDSVVIDALTAKVLDLVVERFEQGVEFPVHFFNQVNETPPQKKAILPKDLSVQQVVKFLSRLENPDQLADLVSCTLLSGALQRQTILETTNLEARLKYLIHFLIAEIDRGGENSVQA
ncbi:MAG: LON peptidase substrate-binding domain-containing protein [Verrucomicrobiota bacterium]|nr:LON peptidase substrate-binding domain-containing protein [Verrucomicrobiota bacterium]